MTSEMSNPFARVVAGSFSKQKSKRASRFYCSSQAEFHAYQAAESNLFGSKPNKLGVIRTMWS
jgi:hypothetical protein